jgi:uncharacterized membrane protein YoaK (UPF0700 family)
MMQPKHVLGALLALALVSGMVDASEAVHGVRTSGWDVASAVLFSFLNFWWYRLDSDVRLYRRSSMLNVGIIAFGIVAIPYYLARSRPAGQKARALLRLAGFGLLLIAGAVIGALIYTLFG